MGGLRQAPFAGPKAVLAYLSRYTHRVAISNQRLVALDERGVTFRWKGSPDRTGQIHSKRTKLEHQAAARVARAAGRLRRARKPSG